MHGVLKSAVFYKQLQLISLKLTFCLHPLHQLTCMLQQQQHTLSVIRVVVAKGKLA